MSRFRRIAGGFRACLGCDPKKTRGERSGDSKVIIPRWRHPMPLAGFTWQHNIDVLENTIEWAYLSERANDTLVQKGVPLQNRKRLCQRLLRSAELRAGATVQMSFLRSMRSKLSGQSFEVFGEGVRVPLSKELTHEIRRHIVELSRKDLTGFTFERRRSVFPQAKSDIVIYDATGTAVLNGREMQGGDTSFWAK